MDPIAIAAWRNACLPHNARRLDNTVPGECDITDPEFQRGVSLPDLTPYQTFPSLINRGNLRNGRTYYAQCLVNGSDELSGIICDYSGDLRQILEVTADNAINPSVYIVRESEEADDAAPINSQVATPALNLGRIPARDDDVTIVEGTVSDTTMVERRPLITKQPTGKSMDIDLKQGSPEPRGCDRASKAQDFLCDPIEIISMLWRFSRSCKMLFTCEERDFDDALNVQPSEAPALASVDPSQYSFDAVTSTDELSDLEYLRSTPVTHFFDRENKVLVHIAKNEGVKLCFENGFALELPPAIVPVIRLPTSSGKTLIYDVAVGKPLPAKFQGWEGVETVIQTLYRSP